MRIRHFFLFAVIITFMAVLLSCDGVAEPKKINSGPVLLTDIAFADANFQQCVMDSTLTGAENEGATMSDEILTLNSCWSMGISSLGGAEKLVNLTSLAVDFNSITSVSPLKGLTSLTTLYLSYNQISNIGPLAGLTNLTDLYISDNLIVDVSPLAGLSSLAFLSLSWNNIATGVNTLTGFTSITTLDIDGNINIPCLHLEGLIAAYPGLVWPSTATPDVNCSNTL